MPAPARDDVDGQIFGYWYEDDRAIPPYPPQYRPTGAVLPRLGTTSLDEFFCLDLVLVQAGPRWVWLPLSESGIYTYVHSLGLFYGGTLCFVTWNEHATVYDVEYADFLPPQSISSHYGKDVAARAREDRDAVQLRLRARRGA